MTDSRYTEGERGIVFLHNIEDIMQNVYTSLSFIYGDMKIKKVSRAENNILHLAFHLSNAVNKLHSTGFFFL
jgi:hypothetical protein